MQNAWERGKESVARAHTAILWLVSGVVLAALGALGQVVATDGVLVRIAFAVGAVVATGFLVPVSWAFVVALIAPVKQRDEARAALKEERRALETAKSEAELAQGEAREILQLSRLRQRLVQRLSTTEKPRFIALEEDRAVPHSMETEYARRLTEQMICDLAELARRYDEVDLASNLSAIEIMAQTPAAVDSAYENATNLVNAFLDASP